MSIDGPDGRQEVEVGGTDPRSIAVSADRSTLVAADWSDGLRAIDVTSGARQLVLGGRYLFTALSSGGDLAWARDDDIGNGRLCTALMSMLTD